MVVLVMLAVAVAVTVATSVASRSPLLLLQAVVAVGRMLAVRLLQPVVDGVVMRPRLLQAGRA